MRRNNNLLKKRHMSVLLILLLVVGIGVGYAALQTTLTINGHTEISAVTWNVLFENAEEVAGADNGSVTIDPENTGDKTKASFTATLNEPGDTYKFTIDVVNRGSIDAKLINQAVEQLSDAENIVVNYTVNGIPENGSKLAKCTSASCATETDKTKFGNYTITVEITYDHDITAANLPTQPMTIEKTISLPYVQFN